MQAKLKNTMPVATLNKLCEEVKQGIYKMDVMPSMRCLMTSGPALERDNMAGFNCSYTVVDSLRAFDEALYILMCGSGIGFSVERQYVSKLPTVPDTFTIQKVPNVITVADSKMGWAEALKELLHYIFVRKVIPRWDLSKVRPAGARLKTFGGRASGPEPLDMLLKFVSKTCLNAGGRQLTSLECHDIMCYVAQAVVVGGVRRSAMISLSNLGDNQLRLAKSGDWFNQQPQRSYANNSVVYTKRPDMPSYMEEWASLMKSRSGERGMFNRDAARAQVHKYGKRDPNHDWGTNPCSEIILRPNQVCNLTEVIVRSGDSLAELKRKVRLATILGTYQSTLTDFKYIRKVWRDNTEAERLLGVSFTGILDHEVLGEVSDKTARWLRELREIAETTNAEYAKQWGIQSSAAITCVKPSGTVSQLVDSASGIHPRHSQYYIRTVRADRKDPLTQFLREQGVPYEDAVSDATGNTGIFSFPIAAPSGATTRGDLTAIQHLELWRQYADSWCEHKPSVTISVRDDEWMDVGAWVWRHFDSCSGLSFLPYTDHVYAQAPYQEVNRREYNDMVRTSPRSLDWEHLRTYEREDNTAGSQTLACSGAICEVVDIGDV
jgi:ribonucleoside-diphosphate reductase alpha chain|tara:strand:- start:3590 stop:5407 length:1818 start_codon:yes stop_codon:yes gene_type:complete